MSIVNVIVAEVPPPGEGLTTATCATPALAKSATVAVTCKSVELTNVVGREVLFHCTVDPDTNPEPDTVTCVAAEPARDELGEMPLTTGMGLDGF